jgi:hypothetical protein
MVVVSGKQYVDDIRKAPDEYLSLAEALAEVRLLHSIIVTHMEFLMNTKSQTVQTRFTLGFLDTHPHHEVTIRTNVTRNIAAKFDEIRDEIVEAFNDYIPLSDGSHFET